MSDRVLIRRDPNLIASGWTAVPNGVIRDSSLSIEARWLWSYIQSHQGTFALRMDQMQEAAGVGRDKMRSMIKELTESGYLSRKQEPVKNGKFGLFVYDLHNPSSAPVTETPATADPSTAQPVTENQSPVLTSEDSTGDVFTGDGSTADGGDNPIKKTISKKTKDLSCAASASPDPRGHRLPEDFQVTPEMVAWCRTEFPHVNGKLETDAFRDYWHGRAGAGARKVNWERTWKNWIRTAAQRSHPGRSRTSGKPQVYTAANGAQLER